MEKDGDPSGGWRFAQCFGDKGEVEEITEGKLILPLPLDADATRWLLNSDVAEPRAETTIPFECVAIRFLLLILESDSDR